MKKIKDTVTNERTVFCFSKIERIRKCALPGKENFAKYFLSRQKDALCSFFAFSTGNSCRCFRDLRWSRDIDHESGARFGFLY